MHETPAELIGSSVKTSQCFHADNECLQYKHFSCFCLAVCSGSAFYRAFRHFLQSRNVCRHSELGFGVRVLQPLNQWYKLIACYYFHEYGNFLNTNFDVKFCAWVTLLPISFSLFFAQIDFITALGIATNYSYNNNNNFRIWF